jgi:tetratricopeptide (TPR) repeat protein
MLRILWTLPVVFLGVSCQSTPDKFAAPTKIEDEVLAEQRLAIANGQAALDAGNWSAADEQFALFMRRYPVSLFSAEAHFGRGRALEGLGQPQAAIQIYRPVGEQARKTAPDTAARAYLRMSYCYEVLGDEVRLMAALADAESFGDKLPKDVRTLEIPVRKAASYMRMGQRDEARKMLKAVEKNLPDVSAISPEDQRQRHAEILVNLGSQDLQSVTPDNFLPAVDALQALQPFLWKAVTLKVAPHSQSAADQLRNSYFTLANLAFRPPTIGGGRSEESSQRHQAELQKKWVARLLESIEALKIFSADSLADGGEQLTSTLKQIEDNGRKILWGRQSLTPLTEESKVHQRPRKEGRVRSQPHFDTEKTAGKGGGQIDVPRPDLTDALVPTVEGTVAPEDPNLKKGNP